MSKNSLLDFYREIVNSEKSFDIDYKNLSKQLIERIDKVIEYINNDENYEEGYCDGKLMIYKERLVYELLKILGEEE